MSKIEIKGLEGLRGLSQKEFDEFNSAMSSDYRYNNLPDEQKSQLYLHRKFKDTFGNAGNYNDIKNLPLTNLEEAKKYWDEYQNYSEDYNKDIYTGYTVESSEGSPIDMETPYEEGIIKPMSDILKGRLNEDQQKIVNDTGKLGDFDSEQFIRAQALNIYDEKKYKEDPMYYKSIDNYASEFRSGFDRSNVSTYNAFTKFDAIADKISPIYKNYKNSEKLGLDVNTTKDVMSYYYAIQNTSGEDEANEFLSEFMQNRIAERQGTGERYWEGFKGVGASCYGSIVSTAGIVAKMLDKDSYDKKTYNPELSNWANYWDKVIDNDLTRYGKDVTTYQTYRQEEIDKIKKAGLSGDTIYKSVKEQQGNLKDMIIGEGGETFGRTFLPSMMQQHGFTVASSLVSFGTTAVLKLAGKMLSGSAKGIKAVTSALKAKKALKAADIADDVVDTVEDVSKFRKVLKDIGAALPGFFGAGLAGTGESVTNALDSKDRLKEQGEQDIEAKYNEWATPQLEKYGKEIVESLSAEQLLRKGSDLEMTDVEFNKRLDESLKNKRKELELQFAPTREKMSKKLEVEAVHAQNTNFAFNQAITGFLNNTLKATIMHPSVSKTFGKLFKDNTLSIAKDGKWYRKTWHYTKRMFSEMFGEGVEEYATEITDAFSRGWHGASFDHYLENGYHNVGTEGIDASIGACLDGARKAAWEAATSTEAAYAFISGAFSSGISTMNVTGIADTYNTFKDPNATTKDKIKSVGSIFLRSSIYEGAMTAKRELEQAENQLKALTDFASSGDNTNTHTNAVAMATFLGERNASTNSELDYRNSHLGAVVSEINLLEKTKQTNPSFYAKTLENVSNLENLDETSDFGKQVIEEYKHAGLAEDNSTDADIAETIRKNAKEFSKFRKKVITRREENERKYGANMDSDILDALTFGDITEEEYGRRINVMTSEIKRSFSKGKEGVEVSDRGGLNKKQKQQYIKYGDKSAIATKRSKAESELNILEAKLLEAKDNLNKATRKNKQKAKQEVNKYKEEIKNKEKYIKDLKDAYSYEADENNQYLSEEDIMELSNSERAYVMSDSYYKTASKKQKDIIDNLKKILEKGDTLLSSSEDSPVRGQSITKIKDIGILDNSVKLHEEIKTKEGKDISNYGRTIKFNALKRRQEDTIRKIGDIQDYNKFEEAIVPLLNNPTTSRASFIAAESILKDNANYKRYKDKRNNVKLIFDKIQQFLEKNKNSFTRAEAEAIYVMGGYLAKNEIDLSNINEIERVLTPENLDTYYKELKGSEVNPNVSFSLELIRDFINNIKDANAQVEQVKQVKKPIETAPVSPLKNLPLTPETPPTVQATEDDKKAALELANPEVKDIKKGIKEVIKSVVDICVKANLDLQSAKVLNTLMAVASFKGHQNENIALAILLAKANNNFDEVKTEDVKRILEVNGVTVSDDDIEMTKLLIEDAKIKVSNDNKVTVNYEDVTDKVNELVIPLLESKTKQTKVEQQPSATEMIIPIDSDDPQIQAAVEKHNVKKYLEERDYSKERNKAVVAVVAHDIPGLITDSSCPIYLVVKNTEGTIKINGVKYQVIGILPPNANIEGSDMASKLQKMAIEQELHKKSGYTTIKKLKKSGSGYSTVAVSFEGYTSKNNTPTHRDKSKKNVSIREEIAGGKKTIKELLQRIVKVTRKISGGKATMVYTSPFTGKEVTYTRDAKEGEKDWTYIAYINHDGKGNEKEIELFVSDLNDYELPIGRKFIEFLVDSKISLEDKFKTLINPKNSGYFVSKYVNTLQSGIEGIIKALEKASPSVVDGEIVLDQETSLILDSLAETLHNSSLNRFIHSKKASLKVLPILEDDKGNITYGIAYEVDGETITTAITLGTFSKVGAVVKFNKSTIGESDIARFVVEALTENSKIRKVGDDTVFKIQVDYNKVDAAKRAFDLEAKKEAGEELTSEELKEYYALQDVVGLIQSNVITHSKEEGLDRQGWEIKITKSVDSFQSEIKQSSQKTTSEGVITPGGLKDPTSGMELDETLTTTPVVNQGVKEALDRLVEAKKARDERKSKGIQEESNLQVESATSRNYSYSEEIDPVVATVGNIYDSATRDLINGDIKTVKELTEKYPNLKQEEATNLFNDVKTLIEAATNEGWTLDAREMYLSTTLPGKNTEGDVEFHGIPDIVGYNANGEIIIIDVKTFSSEIAKDINGAIESWSGQTSDYGNALTKLTGYPIKSVYVFAREVTYNPDADVLGGKLIEGAATSSITSKSRVVGNKLMYELNYQKIDINPEPTETTIDEVINGDDLGIDSSDLGDMFGMIFGDEDFKSEEEKQKEACSK